MKYLHMFLMFTLIILSIVSTSAAETGAKLKLNHNSKAQEAVDWLGSKLIDFEIETSSTFHKETGDKDNIVTKIIEFSMSNCEITEKRLAYKDHLYLVRGNKDYTSSKSDYKETTIKYNLKDIKKVYDFELKIKGSPYIDTYPWNHYKVIVLESEGGEKVISIDSRMTDNIWYPHVAELRKLKAAFDDARIACGAQKDIPEKF